MSQLAKSLTEAALLELSKVREAFCGKKIIPVFTIDDFQILFSYNEVKGWCVETSTRVSFNMPLNSKIFSSLTHFELYALRGGWTGLGSALVGEHGLSVLDPETVLATLTLIVSPFFSSYLSLSLTYTHTHTCRRIPLGLVVPILANLR